MKHLFIAIITRFKLNKISRDIPKRCLKYDRMRVVSSTNYSLYLATSISLALIRK